MASQLSREEIAKRRDAYEVALNDCIRAIQTVRTLKESNERKWALHSLYNSYNQLYKRAMKYAARLVR